VVFVRDIFLTLALDVCDQDSKSIIDIRIFIENCNNPTKVLFQHVVSIPVLCNALMCTGGSNSLLLLPLLCYFDSLSLSLSLSLAIYILVYICRFDSWMYCTFVCRSCKVPYSFLSRVVTTGQCWIHNALYCPQSWSMCSAVWDSCPQVHWAESTILNFVCFESIVACS
jgi:hypothetical protein